jgi:hypothetical protein
MTNNIKAISSAHQAVTSPQIDLDGMDFFSAGEKSPVATEAPKADASKSSTGSQGSSFGAALLSRAQLAGGDSKDSKPDALKLRKPKLLVLRGERIDVQYTVYPGKNYIGRTDEKPVDIDLENQEPADRIWSSRQHAMINFENGQITIEDLGSLNGTFVNRNRINPNEPKLIQENDVVQIGTVQLKLILA